jgi:hypothetical protein
LQAYTQEKVHTVCRLEFWQNCQGCFAIICHALYDLKSSGAAWHVQFAGTLTMYGCNQP